MQEKDIETKRKNRQTVLYILLVVLMIAGFYLIFNAGNPNSLLRVLVSDPSYDIAITMAVCACIVIISGIMMSGSKRDREESIEGMLRLNLDYIKQLKAEGKSDEEISESFLDKLGVKKSGIFRVMAKRRTLQFLSEVKYE
ncbi:MAG: hypothetical protein ACLFNZ_09865 [Spirochaetaceae bacterium]